MRLLSHPGRQVAASVGDGVGEAVGGEDGAPVGLEVGSFEGFELCVAVHEANGDKKGRERSIGLVRFRERSQRREQ